MNDNYNNTNDELLSAFLDNDLSSVEESVLFQRLADDQELRAELHEYMAVRSYVHNDAESLAPPTRLKSGIMQQVRSESPAAPALLERKRRGALGWFAVLALLPAATVIVGSPAALMFLSNTPLEYASSLPNDDAVPLISSIELPISETEDQATTPNASTRATGTQANARSSGSVPDAAQQPLAISSGLETIVPEVAHDPLHAVERSAPRALTLHKSSDSFAASGLSSSARSATATDLPDLFSGFRLGNAAAENPQPVIAVTLRGMSSKSYPTVENPVHSDPWFNNMALAVDYKLSESQSLGLEFGQEPFAQIFRGTAEGRPVRYEQSPLTPWLAIAYQRNFSNIHILPGVTPYGRILAGGSELGPLGKMIGGVRYMPDRRVTMSLGIEGGLLLYRFQSDWFSTRKFGFTYGLDISF